MWDTGCKCLARWNLAAFGIHVLLSQVFITHQKRLDPAQVDSGSCAGCLLPDKAPGLREDHLSHCKYCVVGV